MPLSMKPLPEPVLTLLMLETEFLALGANSMPADALAPNIPRASAGMILAMQDRQYALLFKS